MSRDSFQAIRGMNDVLPDGVVAWHFFEDIVREWTNKYGYRSLRMPILEKTDLFTRSIGTDTDIVEKEMYTFIDHLNGDSLTLRPEGTASCVRAVLQHNLLYDGPKRLTYGGPMFRHERPQQGRYRQFHQVGIEAFGYAGPDIDAEHIIMCGDLWKALGITGLKLQLNSLGSAVTRARYCNSLIAFLEENVSALDEEGRRRLHRNPLRVLDSKNPGMQDVIQRAPIMLKDLDDEAARHFQELQRLLRNANIDFEINPRLVRGLDYYNCTVFEWVTDRLGAQATVCAGGRYDSLVEQFGGKATPACGFAMGVERLLALLERNDAHAAGELPDAYIVHQGEVADALAWEVAHALRSANVKTVFHCGGGTFKAQMKKADMSGARYAVIIGDREAQNKLASLKPLRHPGDQSMMTLEQVIVTIKQR